MSVKIKKLPGKRTNARLQGRTVAMNEQLIISAVRQHEQTEAAENVNVTLHSEIAGYKEAKGILEQLVAGRTAELWERNAQLEVFVHSIAHDLRAPLRAMQSFGQVLARDYASCLDERGRDLANRISESARRLDEMLHDLLAFARIAQNTELAPVDLHLAVKTTLFNYERYIQETKGRVEIVPPMPQALAHGPTLEIVIANLFGNALKFVAPGVIPQVKIWAAETGKMVRLSIQDNGIGIAPQYLKKIFQPFQQLHPGKHEGTGIGLTIVQKGVERMKGRVGVESTPGQGSCFWIELPKA
jgi:signal transduction histidine kinase